MNASLTIWKYLIGFVLGWVLLLLSTSNLIAQTSDSLTCYTNDELKRIATRVVYAAECEQLVALYEQSMINQKQQIENLNAAIVYQKEIITSKDTVITDQKAIITLRDKEIKQTKKELQTTKITLGVSVVTLIAILIASIL